MILTCTFTVSIEASGTAAEFTLKEFLFFEKKVRHIFLKTAT
jgi:hypothetical protein